MDSLVGLLGVRSKKTPIHQRALHIEYGEKLEAKGDVNWPRPRQ